MYKFIGKHILGELYGIRSDFINNLDELELIMRKGIEEANATICGILVKKFVPQGISIVVLLSESHVSIHTYPENGSVFFDIFTCGTNCRPEEFVKYIIKEMKPQKRNIKMVRRGIDENKCR